MQRRYIRAYVCVHVRVRQIWCLLITFFLVTFPFYTASTKTTFMVICVSSTYVHECKDFAQQLRLLSACRAPPELERSGHAKIQSSGQQTIPPLIRR